jgi:hypothetical protein
VITIGLYFFHKRKNTGQNILLLYLIYTQISNFIINPTLSKLTNNNIWGFRQFTILEFTFLSLFIFLILRTSFFKKIIIGTSVTFYSICIFDGLNSNSSSFDSIPSGYAAILLIIFSIFSLYELLQSIDDTFIYEKSKFWFTTGYIMYFAGTFFIFISAQNNFQNPVYFSFFQSLNDLFTIIRNIFFSIGFIINPNSHSVLNLRKNSIVDKTNGFF